MLYNFDTASYTLDLLPTFLRKPKMLAWLKSMIFPLNALQVEAIGFIETTKDELKYSSRTFVLEYYLRKKFTNSAPTLRIVNTNNPAPDVFVGRYDDQQYELFIGRTLADNYTITLHRTGTQSNIRFDFEVILSNYLANNITNATVLEMAASVAKYKTLGRSFRIRNESNTITKYPL